MNPIDANARLKLSVLKNDYKEAEIKLSRLFYELQCLINPYFSNIDEIKAEEIEQAGDDILGVVSHMRELKKTINKIESDLR